MISGGGCYVRCLALAQPRVCLIPSDEFVSGFADQRESFARRRCLGHAHNLFSFEVSPKQLVGRVVRNL